jgi:hypothetical protein
MSVVPDLYGQSLISAIKAKRSPGKKSRKAESILQPPRSEAALYQRLIDLSPLVGS